MVLEGVEPFVLDFPARPTGAHQLGDVGSGGHQVGDPDILTGDLGAAGDPAFATFAYLARCLFCRILNAPRNWNMSATIDLPPVIWFCGLRLIHDANCAARGKRTDRGPAQRTAAVRC